MRLVLHTYGTNRIQDTGLKKKSSIQIQDGTFSFPHKPRCSRHAMISIQAVWNQQMMHEPGRVEWPLLLLPSAQTQRFAYRAETQSAEQFVDAQAAEQAVDDAAEAETVEQLADQTEDTAE